MWKTLSRHRCCEYEHTCRYYPLMWMNYTSHDSVLLQVVIGGINVDFIAKGKTKTLRVRTSLLKIVVFDSHMSKLTSCCSLQFGETNAGSLFQSFGGVGRNLAGAFLHHYITCALRHPRLEFYRLFFSRLPESTGAETTSHLRYWS